MSKKRQQEYFLNDILCTRNILNEIFLKCNNVIVLYFIVYFLDIFSNKYY